MVHLICAALAHQPRGEAGARAGEDIVPTIHSDPAVHHHDNECTRMRSHQKAEFVLDMSDSPSMVLETVIDHTLQWKALKKLQRQESERVAGLDGPTRQRIEPYIRRQKKRLSELAFNAVTSSQGESRTLVTLTSADCQTGPVEVKGGKTVDGLDLEHCGLFEAVVSKATTRKCKFLHKTVVEFLAARYVVVDILQDAFSTNKNKDGQEEYNKPHPYERLELTESVEWLFVADLLRQQLLSETNRTNRHDHTSGGVSLKHYVQNVMQTVAKKFTQLYTQKYQLTKEMLVGTDAFQRSRWADERCVPAVLMFFYTVLPKVPLMERGKSDPDGTREAFRILFEECDSLDSAVGRAAGWFKISHSPWRYLLIEPAARIGALYVLQKVHTEGISKKRMVWAALEAASAVSGERVSRYLLTHWGVSVSIEDAVRLNHTHALNTLLLTSPDVSKINLVADWTPLLQQARDLNDKTALRILLRFLMTSPHMDPRRVKCPSPCLLAATLDEDMSTMIAGESTAWLISMCSPESLYWIATIPRPVHHITSISWMLESVAQGVCRRTDAAFQNHAEHVMLLAKSALDHACSPNAPLDCPRGALLSPLATLCIGWGLSSDNSTRVRQLIKSMRHVPLMTLHPELLRQHVQWVHLRFAKDPFKWRRRMKSTFVPMLASFAKETMSGSDYAVGTVMSLLVAPGYFRNTGRKVKLPILPPTTSSCPLQGFNAEGGSFGCFEFDEHHPRLLVPLPAIVNTLSIPAVLSPTFHVVTLSALCHVVHSAVYSPDGCRIITASEDMTAKIWDPVRGTCLLTLGGDGGHRATVNSARFSPDGRHVVTASNDKTTRIWDPSTGACLLTLGGTAADATPCEGSPTSPSSSSFSFAKAPLTGGHTAAVHSAVYSPNGRYIVTCSSDKTALVYNASSGLCVLTLLGHTATVHSAMYSPDGRCIVTSSSDRTAKVWDATKGLCLITMPMPGTAIPGHTAAVHSAAYSIGGCHIVTASSDGKAKVWDARSGWCTMTLSEHSSAVHSASYSPDDRYIITASCDNTAKVWDAINGTCVQTLSLSPRSSNSNNNGITFSSASFSPTGTHVVTCNAEKTASVWYVVNRVLYPSQTFTGHTAAVCSAAYAPDDQHMVTSSYDKTAKVWDVDRGVCIKTLVGHSAAVCSAAFSPDGLRIVTASVDWTGRIWDARDGTCKVTLSGHTGMVFSAAYARDGSHLVTCSYDKTARIWKPDETTRSGLCVRIFLHRSAVNLAVYSRDGLCVVTCADTTAAVWNVDKGDCVMTLRGHTGSVCHVAYSPDGLHIATSSIDKTVKIWRVEDGECENTIAGHTAAVCSAVYSQDGKYMVTSSWDGTAKVWDVATKVCMKTISEHSTSVYSAAFSHDGQHILTSSWDGTVKVHPALPTLQQGIAMDPIVVDDVMVRRVATAAPSKVEPARDEDEVEPARDEDEVEPARDEDEVEPARDEDEVEPASEGFTFVSGCKCFTEQ